MALSISRAFKTLMVWGRERIRDIERRSLVSVNPLARHAMRVRSHGKQDGILKAIFDGLGVRSGSSVEIGAWDGVTYSNTRWLLENGWTCGFIEGDPEKFELLLKNCEGYRASALNAFVNLEPDHTLDDAIDRLAVGDDLTMLCIDVDGNDYWLWKSLVRYQPWVVCIEYNAYVDPTTRKTIPYNPEHRWIGGFGYGASAGALVALGREKGYTLVAFEPGLDLFSSATINSQAPS